MGINCISSYSRAVHEKFKFQDDYTCNSYFDTSVGLFSLYFQFHPFDFYKISWFPEITP